MIATNAANRAARRKDIRDKSLDLVKILELLELSKDGWI